MHGETVILLTLLHFDAYVNNKAYIYICYKCWCR